MRREDGYASLGRFVPVLLSLLAIPGCSQNASHKPILRGTGEGPGATLVARADLPPPVIGETVYVPVYSYVNIDDNAKPFNLAVTLYVRNTDLGRSIVLKSVRYFQASGTLVRSFLKGPVKLDPLASTSFFVMESDTTGGASPSFLVEWEAGEVTTSPVVEAVMTGNLMNQGVSLTSQGRVIASLPKP